MVRVGPMWNHVRRVHLWTTPLRRDSNVHSGGTSISILNHVAKRISVSIYRLSVHSLSRESNDNKPGKHSSERYLILLPPREQGIVQRESATEEEVIERNQQGENLKYCKKCRSIKPDRAHHCRYT